MRTTLDQNQILYDALNVPEITDFISGEVYKNSERPAGSEVEDIVVGSADITDGTFQRGKANVNLYVKDLKQRINGIDQFVANDGRIKEIVPRVLDLIKEKYGKDWNFYVTNQTIIKEREREGWRFVNFRITFNFHTYKN